MRLARVYHDLPKQLCVGTVSSTGDMYSYRHCCTKAAYLPHVHETHGDCLAHISTVVVKRLKEAWQQVRARQLWQQLCTGHALHHPAYVLHASLQHI